MTIEQNKIKYACVYKYHQDNENKTNDKKRKFVFPSGRDKKHQLTYAKEKY